MWRSQIDNADGGRLRRLESPSRVSEGGDDGYAIATGVSVAGFVNTVKGAADSALNMVGVRDNKARAQAFLKAGANELAKVNADMKTLAGLYAQLARTEQKKQNKKNSEDTNSKHDADITTLKNKIESVKKEATESAGKWIQLTSQGNGLNSMAKATSTPVV